MDSIEERFRSWHTKRKRTLVIFIIEFFLVGLEYSVVLPTAWFYLRQINSPHPTIFQGLIISGYSLTSMAASLILGRYADISRRIKLLILALNTCEVLGTVIYSLPFSPFLLLLGRLVAGCGGAINSVATGELARCYRKDRFGFSMSLCMAGNMLGMLLGPFCNLAFKDVNFWIGKWQITYANTATLGLAVVFFFVQFLALIFVHDLSLEAEVEDLLEYEANGRHLLTCDAEKSDTGQSDTSKLENEGKTNRGNMKNQDIDAGATLISSENNNDNNTEGLLGEKISTVKEIVLHLLKVPSTRAVLIASFIYGFITVSCEVFIPLTADIFFHFKPQQLSIVYVVATIVSALVFVITGRLNRNVKELYFAYCGFLFLTVSLICLLIIGIINKSKKLTIILYWNFIVFISLSCCEIIALRVFMAKLVPDSFQSFAEACRLCVSRIGFTLGGVLAGIGFTSFTIYISTAIGLSIFTVFFLVYVRNLLFDPQPTEI